MRTRYSKARHKKKKRIFREARGFWGARHRLWRTVKQSVRRGKQHAFHGRKRRKRDFRRLWIVRINAACRQLGHSYSKVMGGLKRKNIDINRKMLAELAISDPAAFRAVVESATAA